MKLLKPIFCIATAAVLFFVTSCKKEEKVITTTTTPTDTTGSSFKASKMYFITNPGDTVIHEFDKDKVLTKQTIIENGQLEFIQRLSRVGNYLYVMYYDEQNQPDGVDTIPLDSRGLITAYQDAVLTYNAANYLIKLKIDSIEITGTYVNDNLVSESTGGNTVNYDYYTDKMDYYRLNGLIGEDDGIMGGYVYYPQAGKSSKNLLKSINYGGGDIINFKYDFDSKGLPSKITVTEGNSSTPSGSATIIFK